MDQVANFIKQIVSGTHTSTATTINVTDASAFPNPANGEYNLTWWDSTNYPDPTDDPNVEIVRVTAYNTTSNTLTVTRAQESTTASAKDTSGASYLLILAPTAKTITDIQSELLQAIYPIGAPYISSSSTMPALIASIGTWVRMEGVVIVGASDTDTDFSNGTTGGEKEHTLSLAEIPNKTGSIVMHSSDTATNIGSVGGVFSSGSTKTSYRDGGTMIGGVNSIGAINFSLGGGGGAHNNLPPYKAKYMWERTA